MVVIEKMSKVSHFILVQSTYKSVQIVDIFMREIFQLCCLLRNQFLSYVEIVLKTFIFIIHVTYLYDVFSSEGPKGLDS